MEEKIQELKRKIKKLSDYISLSEKGKKLKELEAKIRRPDFWQKEKNAQEIQKEFAKTKEEIEVIFQLQERVKELEDFAGLSELDESEKKEIKEKAEKLELDIKSQERKVFFSGKYDKNSAIIIIAAGAGGRDAEDWAAMLYRMYQRYCERKGWLCRKLSQNLGEGGGPDGRIGIREALMEAKGKFSYGILKKEAGVHRLVRISPFSAKKLRHTSFVRVEVVPKLKSSEGETKIKQDDLKIETFRSSGPGGQYVNKRESAVRITHLPTGITVSCQVERLQGENRKRAMEILIGKLYAYSQQEEKAELKKFKGAKTAAEFGHQIRSYILHPYRLVKDHRTGVETSNVEEVLDGNIDEFIEAEFKS